MTITRRRAYLILIGLWATLVLPVILGRGGGTSEEYDEEFYHVPEIERLVAIWPRIGFADQGTATSPGYHYVAATIVRLTGTPANGWPVRTANTLIGLALLLVVLHFTMSLTTPGVALLLTLPLGFCSYFLGGSIWLTTDNAALLGVVVCVGLAATGTAAGVATRRALRSGAASLASVAIRQVHLWTIAPLAAALLLDDSRSRGRRVGLASLVALPSVAFVAFFYVQWGGLTPEALEHQHGFGLNGATPAFALALCAGFGLPLLTAARARLRFD